jgi:hypothetical protein
MSTLEDMISTLFARCNGYCDRELPCGVCRTRARFREDVIIARALVELKNWHERRSPQATGVDNEAKEK